MTKSPDLLGTKPLHVAYIIDSLSFGGAERQLVELLKGVVRYRKPICTHLYLFQVGPRGYYQLVEELGIIINHIPRRSKYDPTLLPRLITKLREQKIDLIHSFSVMAGLFGVVSSRWLSLPVVASTIRNAQDTDYKTSFSIRLQSFMADCFISNSQAGFDNRFKRRRKNFKVVYNGVDLQRFQVDEVSRLTASRTYQLDRFSHLVVMAASLSINKDHRTLLQAIPDVLAELPEVGFLFLGDGSEKRSLQRLADELGIADNVLFPGFISDFYPLLANATVAVLLSNANRHQEGIPNSLLEAMAMGLPVIATANGGTLELVRDQVNGVLVPPFDKMAVTKALVTLLKDRELRMKLGQFGRKTVEERFGLDRYVDDYVGIYRELLDDR